MVSTVTIARFSGAMLSALSTGVLFGTRTAVSPSVNSFAPKTYVEVQQATVRNLRPVMGTLLPGALLTNLAVLASSARERRSPGFTLTVSGSVATLAALVLTGVFELPINARVLTWSPDDPPPGWQSLLDRWQRIHTVRTAVSVVGLGCLIAAPLVQRAPSDAR